MSAVVKEDVLHSVAGRWQRIDGLLPDPKLSAEPGCGAELVVAEASGQRILGTEWDGPG